MNELTLERRFRGCLLGGAVGDALGAPVEFMKRSEIIARFGERGITDYAEAYGGLGTITDDTQMTLFTAEGLLRAWVRGSFRGTTTFTGVTARAYLRWLGTQDVHPDTELAGVLGASESGWLVSHRALHSRRAPGNTCLGALRSMTSLGEPAQNDSKGCGGVMRVAPVGLFTWRAEQSLDESFRLGTDLAALTHGHPTGNLTGGYFAAVIHSLVAGDSLEVALTKAKAPLRSVTGHEETLAAIERAEALAQSETDRTIALASLGQGWVAEEALAMSIYCALVATDFRDAMILAVNHDGDSDSTGAITGNLLGAMLGVDAIPHDWLVLLELREVITEIADDLAAFPTWPIGEWSTDAEANERVCAKYPGG